MKKITLISKYYNIKNKFSISITEVSLKTSFVKIRCNMVDTDVLANSHDMLNENCRRWIKAPSLYKDTVDSYVLSVKKGNECAIIESLLDLGGFVILD